jgi:hypothetical protein
MQQAEERLMARGAEYLAIYADQFNRSYSFEYLKRELAILFPEASDQTFAQNAIAKLNSGKVDTPTLQVDGQSLVISFPDRWEIKITKDASTPDQFSINGHPFKFDAHKSLRETHNELCKLMENASSDRGAWFDLLFPRAEAGPISAAKATLGALASIPAIVDAYHAFRDARTSLSSALSACQNRDRSQAYQGSTLETQLKFLKQRGIFNVEQEPLDCPAWVMQQPFSTVVGTQLDSLCKLANRLTACVKEYKLQSTQPSNAPSNGSSR